jgi:7-carboxy-7-deazaguanine synthase
MSLKVNEIFYSIQGESSFSGLPCVFVRLSGCNLRCSYCDTQYAYDDGEDMYIADILDRMSGYNCRLVEVTGGEPLIQEETPELIRHLLNNGYKVLLETNGSRDISIVDERCTRIMDIKCPSSGEHGCNDLENLRRIGDNDELKFVIADRADYEYAKEILDLARKKSTGSSTVHFSPCFGRMDLKELAEWILKDALDVRLHIQLHKIIWGPHVKGV